MFFSMLRKKRLHLVAQPTLLKDYKFNTESANDNLDGCIGCTGKINT